MQIKAAYRLRSYRITEYETGVLWWETHFDFGKQRGGECFVYGNILILKTWSQEKDGLLIGEFLDQLKKLPPWDKTPYYCFASELLDTLTGRGLTSDQLKQMLFGTNRQKPGGPQGLLPGSFRINRYRITVSDEGTISWQTARGVDKIIGGPGSIESGILFLEPVQGDEIKQSRQDFLSHLSRLPQWTVTQAWCRYSALRSCRERQQIGSQGKVTSQPERVDRPIDTGIFSVSPKNSKKETSQATSSLKITASKPLRSFSSWSPKFKWPAFSWPGFSRKIWITGLIVLLFSGLIIATIVFFHEMSEKSSRPYWYKKHYHEHRGEHHSQLKIPVILSMVLLALFFFPGINREAEADEKPIILEESGIHYPGGFDLNTVGEVQGRASHFSRPEKGPVHFLLATDREIYTVLTSPYWYWHENRVKIPEGGEVVVRGSKSFGRDGKLYIIAQELRLPSSGQSFVFRGKDGRPLWKGHHRSGLESTNEFGSSSRERGGFGSGSGFKGHGK